MSILNYAKEHPWATGTIVVIGGIIFIMIVRGGSSSGSSGSTVSRPSDAEIAANATIQAAQIAAQAQATQAGAAVNAAQIGAGVQLNSDNKAAEVAMTQILATKELGLATIGAQSEAVMTQLNADAATQQAFLNSASGLKSGDKTKVLQTYVTGQYAPSKYNTQGGSVWFPQAGNTAGGIISSAGGLISTIGSVFSDQRLKENIVHIGYDDKGRDVFEYNYKGSKTRRRGYIAQQIARSEPQLVHIDEPTGFYKVSAYG